MGKPAEMGKNHLKRNGSSLSDMVLEFLEEEGEGKGWTGNCYNDDGGSDDERRSEDSGSLIESKAFWEEQHLLLQTSLSRSSSLDSRIRIDTEEAMRQLQCSGTICACSNRVTKEYCRICVLRDVSDRLRNVGYNSALCKSKWRRSPDIPSGEHTYIDVVVDATSAKKKGPVRIVIELNFRAEFEMARASQEYNNLVNRLPEVFVGKSEKLRNVIKTMCAAAKKCMKDNKMHMAPWRKHKYMQSKWLGTCQRMPMSSRPLFPTEFSDRQPKLRASMLTLDLHCTVVVEVV